MADVDISGLTSAQRGAEAVGLANLKGASNFAEGVLNAMKVGVAMNAKQSNFENELQKLALAQDRINLTRASLDDRSERGHESLRLQAIRDENTNIRGHTALDLREKQIAAAETKRLNEENRKTEIVNDSNDYQNKLSRIKAEIGTDEWFKEATMINNSVKFPGSVENNRVWARYSQEHYDAYNRRRKDLADLTEIEKLEKARSGLTPYQMDRPADYWGYRKPDPGYPQGALYLPIDESGAAVHWKVAAGQSADVDVIDPKTGKPSGQKKPRYQYVTLGFDKFGEMKQLSQKLKEQQSKLMHTPPPPEQGYGPEEHRNFAIATLSDPQASVEEKQAALQIVQKIDMNKRQRIQKDIKANDYGWSWVPGHF